jgi:uncharacterized membrane protein YkvA (DUF1232 family)
MGRLRDLALFLPQMVGLVTRLSADPRVPRRVKAMLAVTAVYLASPIDLIPDFIPVLGHLDDVVLVPLGIYVAIRLIPPEVLAECRARAGL